MLLALDPDYNREMTSVSPAMQLKLCSLKVRASFLNTEGLLSHPSMRWKTETGASTIAYLSFYVAVFIFPLENPSNLFLCLANNNSYFKNKILHHCIHSICLLLASHSCIQSVTNDLLFDFNMDFPLSEHL